jgi:DHA3 family macrolide efflux protein-like MFS transporter
MGSPVRSGLHWQRLFSNAGFSFYFTGMFISLFGTGLNFAGVTLYVLTQTHSTVQVSFTVVLLTIPRLLVPPFGGVLTDRVDRRYLSMALDLIRAAIVFGAAILAWRGRLELGPLYAMVLLLGVGFAIYWSSSLALLQELIPQEQLVSANAAVLVAVQGGMLIAGALVGFIYVRAGLAGILAIDGTTYAISALCLYALRHGYCAPRAESEELLETAAGIEAASGVAEAGPLLLDEPQHGPLTSLWADIEEGLKYLRAEPSVAALGLTYACMMAGVISANVVVVALAYDLLRAGPHGYGFIQSGWALGAVLGGLAAGPLSRQRPFAVLIAALIVLAVGHAVFPYAPWLAAAVAMNVVFGACRALGAVLTQSAILATVPRRLMGRVQSAFAAMATFFQVLMSLALGWLAQHYGLPVAFLLLGLLYGVAVMAALRARSLCAMHTMEVPAN